MSITMFDAVPEGVGAIPADAQAVAGYVDGFYVSFPLLVERFYPRAHCLSIAVHPEEDAACLDVEAGDASIGETPAWIHRQMDRGQWRPCVYASQDYWENQGLRSELQAFGGGIRRWVAAYPGIGPEVPAGYDAHQYSDQGGGGLYDISVCLDSFFPGPPARPPDPFHYDRFPQDTWNTPFGALTERQVVLLYDGARKHVDRQGHSKYRGWLRLLREELHYLAERVRYEADHGPFPGWRPSWRRWRFEQLRQRAQGNRLA